ncbi:unnamed protein product [Adineta ricciae]|uniref:G-protein coupled receptors family 1 profile domain-containing protein n=1 Tax=Adineta ricciae TaxID=249248 RepID=A0A814YYP9_ADIRI|nr:unnamed protein product [Adineta ricciae]CAF1586318.1 unnamed protein product [Adineta ricciae]
MLLVANSCLLNGVFASVRIGANSFTFGNDLNGIEYQDSLCIFRAYIADGICSALIFSFSLQAAYRYVIAIHPHWLFWQLARVQILLICFTWLFGLLYPLEFLLRGEIIYNAANQICQLPIQPSFSIVYMVFCIYLIPISLIVLIYLKLVRYVKEVRERVISTNILLRAQRELKMVRQIILVISTLLLLGLPYTTFIVMSFVTELPKYHFRIALVFLDASLVFICISLFYFNEPLKMSILRRIGRRRNIVATIIV